MIAWVYFDEPARAAFRAAMGGDAGLWARARGWALWKAALVAAGGGVGNGIEKEPLAVIAAVLDDHRTEMMRRGG